MNFDQEISVNVKLTGSVDGKTQNIFYLDFCDRKIAVDIPNTISVGETLRLKGMGQTAPDGTRGDLYLRIKSIDDSQLHTKSRSCKICGHPINQSDNFCPSCGTPVNSNFKESQREKEWSGHVVNCPSCGAAINSFTAFCPSCGHEFRGSKSSRSLQDFSSQLNNAQTVFEKETIIRNFPIPNTREDILEFSILATSNLIQQNQDTLFDAWVSKFEQCIQKSRLLCRSQEDLFEFERINIQTQKIIRKKKLSRLFENIKHFFGTLFTNLPHLSISFAILAIIIFEIWRISDGTFVFADIIIDLLLIWGLVKLYRLGQGFPQEIHTQDQSPEIKVLVLRIIKGILSNPISVLIICLFLWLLFDEISFEIERFLFW